MNGEQNPEELGNSRLDYLKRIYIDIADEDGAIQPETVDYLRSGGSLRLCLNEIMALSEQSRADQQLAQLRSDYVDVLFKRRSILRPHERQVYDELADQRQTSYVDAVVDKLARTIDARTPEESLAVGQLPTLVRDASFEDGKPLSMEDLAGNHLYILIDTALKENARRREIKNAHRDRGPIAKLIGNRILRITVATSVIVASLIPKFNIVPQREDFLSADAEIALRAISTLIIFVDLPEVIRSKYLESSYKKHSQDLYDQMSSTRDRCDLALRMIYGSTRYGDTGHGSVTGRDGTDDIAENLRRLQHLDNDFQHLANDPGGKPYTGGQALDYAARLLVERQDQLADIIEPSKTAEQQREAFLKLSKDLLTEDVRRMKKNLNVTRFRRMYMGALALVPAVLAPAESAALSDAAALGQDVAEFFRPSKDDDNGYED